MLWNRSEEINIYRKGDVAGICRRITEYESYSYGVQQRLLGTWIK